MSVAVAAGASILGGLGLNFLACNRQWKINREGAAAVEAGDTARVRELIDSDRAYKKVMTGVQIASGVALLGIGLPAAATVGAGPRLAYTAAIGLPLAMAGLLTIPMGLGVARDGWALDSTKLVPKAVDFVTGDR